MRRIAAAIGLVILLGLPLTAGLVVEARPFAALRFSILTLATRECPKLFALVQVRNLAGGPVGGLDVSNFSVTDNDASPDSMWIVSAVEGLDIAFLLDTSQSMEDNIIQVADNVEVIVDSLAAAGINPKFCLIYCGGGGRVVLADTCTWDPSPLVDSLRYIVDSQDWGSGHEDEYGAVDLALGLPWRDRTLKVAILMSDEPYQDNGWNLAPEQSEEQRERVISAGLVVHCVSEPNEDPTGCYEALCSESGGYCYSIYDPFSDVADSIIAYVKSTYQVFWISPDRVLRHSVCMAARDIAGNRGERCSTFIADQEPTIEVDPTVCRRDLSCGEEEVSCPIQVTNICSVDVDVQACLTGGDASHFRLDRSSFTIVPQQAETVMLTFTFPSGLGWMDSGTRVDFLTEGCRGYHTSVSVEVERCITVGRAFTPNGDGINDLFTVKVEPVPTRQRLTVYDRWGKQIMSVTAAEWDGRDDSGRELPTGHYFYRFEGDGEILKSGTIALIR